MGQLHDAVGSSARVRRPAPPQPWSRFVALAAASVLLVAGLASGCAPVVPTGPTASGGPSADPSASVRAPGSPATIDPGVGRLVWLVDRAGGFGIWTTDLAGGDVRTYQSDLDEAGNSLRDARLVGDDVVLIRDGPTAELWILSPTTPPRRLLDNVNSFVQRGTRELIAVRDVGTERAIWRVPLDGPPPAVIAELPVPDHGPQVGPFGFAISPDGRTVAAGWVGGPVEVIGPKPATRRDIGAPLVVADDGRIVAVTGRVGDAYLLDGDRMVELAAPESDPLAAPGSGLVAWASIGDDGALDAVELRDVLAGTSATYPASGTATNVVGLTPDHIVLEATAFDPQRRTSSVVDRHSGRFETFEATAPAAD